MKVEAPAIGSAPQIKPSSKEDIRLKKTCEDFESVLVSYMLGQMRSTVQKSDLFGSSEGEEMFQGMMDQEIAKNISSTKSMGVADLLYSQLSKLETPKSD